MDFLYNHDYMLRAKNGLKLNGKKIPTETNNDTLGILRVIAATRQVIPARTQLIINGLSAAGKLDTTLAVVEPCLYNKTEIFVGRALVNLDQPDSSIPVRLLNLSDSDITIHKGVVIASIRAVDSVVLAGDIEGAGTPKAQAKDNPQAKDGAWPGCGNVPAPEVLCWLDRPRAGAVT